MSSQEFKAIILAGGEGFGLVPLTHKTPKCLLPVGTYPLIFFTIVYVRKQGFKDVWIVTKRCWRQMIEDELEIVMKRLNISKLGIQIHYIEFDENEVSHGSAYIIGHILDNVVGENYVIFSGDIYGKPKSFYFNINIHRRMDADLTVAFNKSTYFPLDIPCGRFYKAPKKKNKVVTLVNDPDYFGVNINERRLVYMCNATEDSSIGILNEFLYRFSPVKIYAKRHDLHMYIIKRTSLEYVRMRMEDTPELEIESIRVDVVPMLIERQSTIVRNKELILGDQYPSFSTQIINFRNLDINDPPPISSLSQYFNHGSNPSRDESYKFYINQEMAMDDLICTYYFSKTTENCFRINTVDSYMLGNMVFNAEKETLFSSLLKDVKDDLENKRGIKNSIIETPFERKLGSSITMSNISRNCVIGEKTKIIKTIILKNVGIGNNCHIENSILGENCVIEDNCTINDSIIGPDQIISQNSIIIGETCEGTRAVDLEEYIKLND